ncbi:hypothetical protein MTsN2n4_39460 [Pseudoalteromonas sp. MTN2-4]
MEYKIINMKKTLLVTSLLALLQGCSGMKYTPMTQETRDAVKTTQAYNLVIQDEARPAVELSNASGALGGGLIAAAIDSSINDDRALGAFGVAAPLLNSTLDVNFRKLIVEEMNPVLVSEFNASSAEQAEARLLRDKDVKAKITQLKEGEAFLYLSTFYQFHDDFKVLQFETVANLYIAKEGKRSATKPDYRNTFTYISDQVGTGSVNSINLWNENNAALYRSTIKDSLTQIRKMLEADIKVEKNEACLGGTKYHTFNVLGKVHAKGTVISKENNRVLLRNKNGALVHTTNDLLGKPVKKLCGA